MPQPERLTLRALARSGEVYLQHLPGVSLVFLIAQLPLIIAFAADPMGPAGLGFDADLEFMAADLIVGTSANALAFLATTALQTVALAIVLFSVFNRLEGRPTSLLASARHGLRRLGAVLATGLFVAAFTVYGFVLYVIPGLFALGYFWLSVPACVVERVSPFRALGRSGELASGSVGLMIVLALVTFVLPLVLEVLVGGALQGSPGAAFALILAIRVLFAGVAAVAVAVAYRELRRIKDDADGLALIRAFD